MTRFNRFVADHPWVAILGFLAVTAVFAIRIPQLYIETDLLEMMPKKHPVFIYNTWVEDYFDIESPALIGIVNEGPEGVFTPETLALVKHLSDAVRELPLVDGEDLVSLTEVDNITGDEDGLHVDAFYDEAPTTREGALAVRDAVFDNEPMVGSLVSPDGEATMILVEKLEEADKVELYRAIREIVAAAPVHHEEIFISGRPIIEGEMTVLARRDLARMFPLVILTAGALLWITLRSLRGALLPLLVVLVSVIWTVGLMAWVGAQFFTIQSMMPTLLVAIGVADGIHVIHHYFLAVATTPERPRSELVFDTMESMTRPVVMTSLTTAAGFLSLAVSPMRPIQSFGIYTAFGVMAAMVFSLTLLPGLLVLLRTPVKAAQRTLHTQRAEGGLVATLLNAMTPLITRRPVLAMSGGVLFLIIGMAGLPRVVVDGSLLQNFPRGNAVKIADRQLTKHFRGTQPLQIVLDAGEFDGWKDPERLRAMDALQAYVETAGHVGQTRSIADLIKRMNEVMNPEDPAAFRVPDDRDLVAQYLFLYSLSGEPDDFEDVIDYDYRQANVRAQVDSDHSPILGEVIERVQAYADEHLAPLGITTRMAGSAQTSYTFMGLIIRGQVRSLIIAIILVGLLTGWMCRAVSAGVITVIPVALASVLNFGLLAWFDVSLSVTTALLSSMGIGIGIDYAIHFVVKYQRTRLRGVEPDAAMHETLSTAGVAISYNALVVLAGFTVLATSQFPPNRILGALVALNMAVCFLGTVTAMAAILHLLQPRFVQPPQRHEVQV